MYIYIIKMARISFLTENIHRFDIYTRDHK